VAKLTERQIDIVYKLLKHSLKQELSLRNIANLKREVGNIAKEIGASEAEILGVGEIIIRECFEEQMGTVFKK